MRKFVKGMLLFIVGVMVGIVTGEYCVGHKYCLKLADGRGMSDKHLTMVRLYDIWVMIKQNGTSIGKYFEERGIREIAIYGMSYMGTRLFYELKSSSIRVKYGIDCNPKMKIMELEILHLEEVKETNVDAVIVTAIFSFDSIKADLEKIGFKDIIALDELLYTLV